VSQDKGKRLVYVPAELLKGVAEASRRRGQSIGKFVEEVLREAVRVDEAGYSPKQIADFFRVLQAQRVLGGVFVPLDVLNYLTEKAYKDEMQTQQLQEIWYESGRWYGRYMKEKFDDPLQAFKIFLGASRWDLNEVELNKGEDTVKLRCVSTVLTREETDLLAEFIGGAIDSMGYKTEKTDHMRGMIVLELRA